MSTTLSNWPRNRLLLALPSRNLNQLLPELEHVRCQREQILMIFTLNNFETAKFPQKILGSSGTNSHPSKREEPGADGNQALYAQCRP
jgi:hypothetical protein